MVTYKRAFVLDVTMTHDEARLLKQEMEDLFGEAVHNRSCKPVGDSPFAVLYRELCKVTTI